MHDSGLRVNGSWPCSAVKTARWWRSTCVHSESVGTSEVRLSYPANHVLSCRSLQYSSTCVLIVRRPGDLLGSRQRAFSPSSTRAVAPDRVQRAFIRSRRPPGAKHLLRRFGRRSVWTVAACPACGDKGRTPMIRPGIEPNRTSQFGDSRRMEHQLAPIPETMEQDERGRAAPVLGRPRSTRVRRTRRALRGHRRPATTGGRHPQNHDT